ncbi:MAG: hypothetical protein GY719_24090 [bacterium]|nr:hypothetical protein [bacterium]
MNSFERLARDFVFEEAILESIETPNLRDVVLTFSIWEGNLSLAFEGDFEQAFPDERLVLRCCNCARFEIDRLRHGKPELLLVRVTPPPTKTAEEGPKTVFGFNFHGDSEQLRSLGEYRDRFRHLSIDTVDARISVVFEELVLVYGPAETWPSSPTAGGS